MGPNEQNGARSASYRTVDTLEAQVSDVRATHTGHHALNIITTHSYIKTHTNTADGIGVHADAQQQVAKDWASSSSIHTDTPRSALRYAPHALSLCVSGSMFSSIWVCSPSRVCEKRWGKKSGCFENVLPRLTASLCLNPRKHACLTSVYNCSCRHVHYWLNCMLGVIVWHILTPDSLALHHI